MRRSSPLVRLTILRTRAKVDERSVLVSLTPAGR